MISIAAFLVAAAGLAWTVRKDMSAPKHGLRATYVVSAFEWPPTVDSLIDADRLNYSRRFGDVRGFVEIKAQNLGSLIARQVMVRVPDLEMWCMTRELSKRECRHDARPIALGDLAVGETVILRAWTRHAMSGFDEVSVTHSEGFGDAERMPIIEEEGWIQRFGGPLFVWLIIASVLLLLRGVVVTRVDDPAPSETPAADPPPDQPRASDVSH